MTNKAEYRKARDEVDSAIAHLDHAITVLHEADLGLYIRKQLADIAIVLNEHAGSLESRT